MTRLRPLFEGSWLSHVRDDLGAVLSRVPDPLKLVSRTWTAPEETSAKSFPATGEFVHAWKELAEHPALLWVPPIWRSDTFCAARPSPAELKHAVRAIDRNLVVHVYAGDDPFVELAVAPLSDRKIGSRVDPTTPVGEVAPHLKVRGQSFEEAVVELRNVVFDYYGQPGRTQSAFEHDACSHQERPSGSTPGTHVDPVAGTPPAMRLVTSD